jgi:hypothetical protein
MTLYTNVALFLVGVVSLALYLAIIVLLIKRRNEKNFSSPFFKIFISLGLIDICQLVSSYVTLRFPMFGLFPSLYNGEFGAWLAKYACFAVWFFIFGQFTGNLLMAVNRYTTFKYAKNNNTVDSFFLTVPCMRNDCIRHALYSAEHLVTPVQNIVINNLPYLFK